MTGSTEEWTTAPLVALDLEGSGAQDRDDEAILEIARPGTISAAIVGRHDETHLSSAIGRP
jgi:hypothetical protein